MCVGDANLLDMKLLQQVDFQRPVVISQVATQGARQFFQAQYVSSYYISYSNDRRSWSFYKGDSRDVVKVERVWLMQVGCVIFSTPLFYD